MQHLIGYTTIKKSVAMRIALAATLFVGSFGGTLFATRQDAEASHSDSYVFPGAPFNGTWNLGDYAPPATHHVPWFGDWSTDYYQVSYTRGYFWPWTNYGSGSAGGGYGFIGEKGSSCANANDWAGWHYRIDLYNPGGYRGWIILAHVSEYGQYYWMQSDQQFWNVNDRINWANTIGWTAYWGNGQGVPSNVPSYLKCYDVSYDTSNHWHVEMGQQLSGWWIVGYAHYSCHYNYTQSNALYSGDYLGIAGANSTSTRAIC